MSSNITLALVRQASVFESLAKGSIQSERIVPGSCSIVLPTEATWRAVIRDRLGRDFRRDLAEEMDREFEHRAFLVDHAVELAVGARGRNGRRPETRRHPRGFPRPSAPRC